MTEVTELRDFLAKEDEAASAEFQSVMTTEQQESVVVSRSDEHWADDVRAVLNTVESERSVLLREADGGPVAILFAASHLHRTRGLIPVKTTASYDPETGPIGAWDGKVLLRDRSVVKEIVAPVCPSFREAVP